MRLAAPLAALALAALAAPAASAQIAATRIATGLARPLWVEEAPDATGRLFVVEQRSSNQGRIRIIDSSGTLLATPALQITVTTGSEQGLLGFAFHPDFASNQLIYVNYTRTDGDTVVAEYRMTAPASNTVDPASARTIMIIDQPAANHNGGWISFGPDGYLYISLGDGGSANDPWGTFGNGQDLSTLLGAMLRVDVNADDFPADPNRNYAVPPSNPFVDADPLTADEIWAWGLRNAWRNDFDPDTGDLYIADVGQNQREEVNFQPASSTGGENYGWRKWEGTRLNFAADPAPAMADAVFPVAEYLHGSPDFGCSVTGGVLVRACDLPMLYREFLYADYCSNRIYAVRSTVSGWVAEEITSMITPDVGTLSSIISFGTDLDERVYVCTQGGSIYRLSSPFALADLDQSGSFSLDDVVLFTDGFSGSLPIADLDQDGALTLDDVALFAASFTAGPCP